MLVLHLQQTHINASGVALVETLGQESMRIAELWNKVGSEDTSPCINKQEIQC